MVNSFFEVSGHALESLSENLLDLLDNGSFSGSMRELVRVDEKGAGYLDSLVDW